MVEGIGQLQGTLEDAGYSTERWSAGDGELLILPHAARVLACTIPGSGGNLFWHNPGLNDADTAGEIVQAAGGELGGDRLWIAPEVAYMWPSLEDARRDPKGTAHTPRQIDPGDWRVRDQGPAHVSLATRMVLTDNRTDRTIRLEVGRHIHVISEPVGLPDELQGVSFVVRNELRLVQDEHGPGEEGAVAGAWDLLQVPTTGTIICPTVMRVDSPRSYYDPFGDRHVQSDDHCVRFLVDGQRRTKMGLLAEHTTGRMGYYRRLTDTQSSLIVRFFAPQPGEPYVDLPRASDETFGGDCLQAYNDDGGPASLGELESHDPALVVGCQPTERSGTCLTHVLLGPDDAIRQAGLALLGVPVEPIE